MSMPEHRWIFRSSAPSHVRDGDTFVVARLDRGFGQYDEGPSPLTVIRLKDCYCPELHAGGGAEAAAFTAAWLSQIGTDAWPLLLETDMLPEPKHDEMLDNWSRFVARVWRTWDGRSLNDDLIAAGHGTVKKGS